jgi:hypothetical protein
MPEEKRRLDILSGKRIYGKFTPDTVQFPDCYIYFIPIAFFPGY